jgi:hypothetical protein
MQRRNSGKPVYSDFKGHIYWTDCFVEFLSPATAAFFCFFVLNFCHLQRLLFDICFVLIRGSLIFFLVGNFGHLQRLQRLLFEVFFMGSSLVFFLVGIFCHLQRLQRLQRLLFGASCKCIYIFGTSDTSMSAEPPIKNKNIKKL